MSLGFAPRLAALYAAIFVLGGIQLPFLPVWLKAKELDAGQIGLVLAVPMVVRILAIPIAARIADRRDALRATIVVACALSAMGYALVGQASGLVAILAAFTLVSLVFTPIMPLTETYALKGLAQHGGVYGPVRLWGSAAFILGTFIAGYASDTIPALQLIWLIVTASAVNALAAAALVPLSTGPPPASAPARPRPHLLRDPAFIAVLAAASLIQASHAMYYAFSTLAWRANGLDGTAIAALWGLGVIAEIVLFALQGRLPAWLTPTMLLMLGGAGGALRWTGMAFDPPALALPFLQLLHAASFGATHLGALTFLARHAPAGQGATAQGYLAIALGVVMAAGMGLSGVLYAAYGASSYAAMALAAVVGGGCAFVAYRLVRDPAN